MHNVYLEEGKKRTFAVSVDWPGWARHGRNEAEAIDALLAYAPKYAAILKGTRLGFVAPKSIAELTIVGGWKGTSPLTGAPAVLLPDGERSCDASELKRFKDLNAGWCTMPPPGRHTGRRSQRSARGGGAPSNDRRACWNEAAYIAAVGGRRGSGGIAAD
jgi:hypothetical protein